MNNKIVLFQSRFQCTSANNGWFSGKLWNTTGITNGGFSHYSKLWQLEREASGQAEDSCISVHLGKATLRGIRKCPQCGVYNGTRGLSCKNKACGTIFRDGDHGTGRLKKGACEVVRVVTDSGGGRAGGPQVFSVRQRGRGSETTRLCWVSPHGYSYYYRRWNPVDPCQTSVAVTCPLASRMKVNWQLKLAISKCRNHPKSLYPCEASHGVSDPSNTSATQELCAGGPSDHFPGQGRIVETGYRDTGTPSAEGL